MLTFIDHAASLLPLLFSILEENHHFGDFASLLLNCGAADENNVIVSAVCPGSGTPAQTEHLCQVVLSP